MISLINFARNTVFAVALAVATAAPMGVAISLVSAGPAQAAVASSVSIQGQQRVEAETIKTYITIKPGVAYGAQDIDESVKILYGTGLFADVAIAQRGSVLVVTVVENPVINTVIFQGNKKVKSNVLSTVVFLEPRGVLTEARLQSDIARISEYYSTQGRAQAYVDAKVTYLEGNRADVVFLIDEGEKYTFGEIAIDSSIPGVDSATLQSFITFKSGRTFDATEVETTVENLTIELSRLGYVFALVQPRGDRDYANNIIAITFVIDEGPRAYVERIEIIGNTKTRDYVIRREFQISEGDAYNRVLIDKAERRLRGLGYFSTVAITTQQGSAPDKVVVVVHVEDQSTGSFSVAAGVSTTQGLIAEVALEETNFLGRGQNLRISYGGGKNDQTFNLAFSDPYFLGYRMSAGFNVYRNTSTPSSLRSFSSTTTGGGVSVGLPLTDDLQASLNYRISNQMTSGAAACAPAAGGGTATACYFPDGTRLTSSAGYSLQYSTIDNMLDPSEGVFLRVSQDFAGIGGSARFMRTQADARWYHPIGAKTDIVGQLSVKGGNITGFGGMPVSISDNFFKGGETIRGFAPLGYGPRDQSPCIADAPPGAGCGMAIGGKNFWVASAEVQFPLPVLPPDFGLRGAVFADAGMLWGFDAGALPGAGEVPVSDTIIRSSVGASILWASPLGNLRLDFAQALSKATYDNTQFFRIGAGASF